MISFSVSSIRDSKNYEDNTGELSTILKCTIQRDIVIVCLNSRTKVSDGIIFNTDSIRFDFIYYLGIKIAYGFFVL